MIINLLFIITGFFGILTVIITLSNYSVNRIINLFLTLIFALISIRFLLKGLFPFGYLTFLITYYVPYSKFLILIIPSFYLYFKNLIADQKLFQKVDFIHYLFPIGFLLLNFSLLSSATLFPALFYFSFYTVLFLYNLVYCFLIYQVLKKNVWTKKEASITNNKHHKLIKNWTIFLFVIIVISSLKLFTVLFLDEHNHNGFVAGEHFQWVSAIVWILTFFKILISPEIVYGYPIFKEVINENKIANIALDSDWIIEFKKNSNNVQDTKLKEKIDKNILYYIVEIDKVAKEFELFSNPNFSIYNLALRLNIPNSNLNYIFKYHSKISFSDYKNKIRIQYSIQLIASDYLNTNTLESLAKKAGFASYNPFFTSFKKNIGISPQKYITQRNASKNKKVQH